VTELGGSAVRIAAVARRHLIVIRRVPFRLFDIVMWPIVDVVLYGSIGAFVTTQSSAASRSSATYMLAGIMLFHFLYQTQVSNSTAFLEETWSRNLLNILTTPVSEWEYAAGISVVGLLKVIVGIGVVALAGLVLFAFNLFDLGLMLLPVALSLMVMGWAMSLFVIGLVLRFGQAAEAWTWGILFLVMPLSGIFYPTSALPAALRPIGTILPTTYAFAAARRVLDGGSTPWGDLGWAFLGAVASVVVGIWFLGRMLRLFRRRGFVTRFS
jgi:ABC-2 type transport system permease protein